MWRNLRKLKIFSELHPSLNAFTPVRSPKHSYLLGKIRPFGSFELGFCQDSVFRRNSEVGCHKLAISRDPFGIFGNSRGYAATAEALVSTSEDDDDEIQELIEEINKEINVEKQPKMVGGMGLGKYNILRKRQIKMETEAWEEAAKEYQELLVDMCEQKLAPNLPYIKSLFLGWFEPLRDAIAAEQDLCKQGKNRGAYAPHFDLLPPGMMAVITMHKLMGLLMTGGGNGSARVVQAASHIGEAIEHEVSIDNKDYAIMCCNLTKRAPFFGYSLRAPALCIINNYGARHETPIIFFVRIHKFLDNSKRKNALNRTSEEEPDPTAEQQEKLRKRVKSLIKKQKVQQVRKIVKQQDDLKPWGQDAQIKVGCRLIQILMQTAYIQPPVDQMEDAPPDIRPAFMHTLKSVETQKGISRRYGVIECDPLVRKGLEKTARHMVIPYMPMLVPPLNWTGYERGAYLFLPSYIMRTHGAKQQREVVKRTPKQQLEPIFQALNTLGNTKWKVNKRILSVVDRIWASGGRLADLVDRDDVPLPEEPFEQDETEMKKWKWKVKAAKKVNSERHSQRCDIELKLAVARKMKDEEGFYYPHNLDFRGRAYPMHPYLNHLGSDLCRGVLEFAEGRPLGKSGLRWLKVHLANLYGGGVDKLSYEGRIAFAENHLDDIFDSCDRPLQGNRWWLGAEDPFQCLATCMNLSEALRSPFPETTISYLPVHQDGSCNGLQHYAALGRDKLGAAAVNLVGGDKPADVYSGIAARVVEIMKNDAAKDPATDPNVMRARILISQVDRKLVKQTVMTSVYGVTYIGARDQIKRRLKERGAIEDDAESFAAACYAAKTTLTALGEMFEAARSIMSWLGDCAKIIAMENEPVRWTTPLGLPVVQPYRKLGKHVIKTSLQVLTLQRETDKVMAKRQRTAFPPNFVHSLDGSHMMMTANACSEAGLNFAGVHDSYWTHACDVDTMNKILREKFVELYEAPILENLLESFQKSFPKLNFPPLPERGDFDLREVLESTYFFN